MSPHTLDRTRRDLSEFLLHHRAKLTPADVGLPSGGRRRTPGLRREEVAALAGVGVTWYTWFEQGREIGVSETFLLGVAHALRLDDADCRHLFLLAHGRPPRPEAQPWPSVTPLIQRLMDELAIMPCYVINLRWDVIGWNAAADRLLQLASRLRSERNLMHMVFADPGFRRRLPSWREEAPRLLASFRRDLAAVPEDAAVLGLVDELTHRSAEFRRWWAKPEPQTHSRGLRSIVDGRGNVVEFQHEVMTVDEYRHLRMIVYFAPGCATDTDPRSADSAITGT